MTAAARRILDHLDGAEDTQNPPGDGQPSPPAGPASQPGAARVLATA
ncbi:hypothetical protein [Blastococcus sp. TF02A-35]|nr:hypothetical protein [Blastococcus sp. TF02A_35]